MFRKNCLYRNRIPKKFLAIFFFVVCANSFAVTESQVFDWWDDGLITPEEASEILDQLEIGNETEACILAETYAQEPCNVFVEESKTIKKKEKKKVSGYFLHKNRLDSLGHVERYWNEFQVSFYRYTLRLGSQELLSYKNQGSEAFFGDISTKELHSQIPTDTLWGTALLYPLGQFHIAGLLDTSLATQARVGYTFQKKQSLEFFLWHKDTLSAGIQSAFPLGLISLWWQQHQNFPLLKIQLQEQEKTSKKFTENNPDKIFYWSWKLNAYIHGNETPQFARLSSSILKNRLWGMETITATAPRWLNTKITHSMRFLNSLHNDSLSLRIKTEIQSGPTYLRPGLASSCLEANENCNKTNWKAYVQSTLVDHWHFLNSVKVLFTKGEGFAEPRYETSIMYTDTPKNFSRISLISPKGFDLEKLHLRSEIHFSKDFLEFSLATTFKRTEEGFHPYRAFASAKILF